MQLQSTGGPEPKLTIEMGAHEAAHLLSILMHAKFGDDVSMNVVLSPTTNALLRGIIEAGSTLGLDLVQSPDWMTIKEEGGLTAPASFRIIESELQRFPHSLVEALYPYKWIKRGAEE